jgi:hypothetical protein
MFSEVTESAGISRKENQPVRSAIRLNPATVTAIADKDDREVSDKSDVSVTPISARSIATTED